MAEGPLSETRRKEPESEKITINLGFVDLGHIDLLVAEGFYSNRTDFIRTAIRNQVQTHGEVLKSSVARRSMVLGLQRFTRQDLEKLLTAGEHLHIHVVPRWNGDTNFMPVLASTTVVPEALKDIAAKLRRALVS